MGFIMSVASWLPTIFDAFRVLHSFVTPIPITDSDLNGFCGTEQDLPSSESGEVLVGTGTAVHIKTDGTCDVIAAEHLAESGIVYDITKQDDGSFIIHNPYAGILDVEFELSDDGLVSILDISRRIHLMDGQSLLVDQHGIPSIGDPYQYEYNDKSFSDNNLALQATPNGLSVTNNSGENIIFDIDSVGGWTFFHAVNHDGSYNLYAVVEDGQIKSLDSSHEEDKSVEVTSMTDGQVITHLDSGNIKWERFNDATAFTSFIIPANGSSFVDKSRSENGDLSLEGSGEILYYSYHEYNPESLVKSGYEHIGNGVYVNYDSYCDWEGNCESPGVDIINTNEYPVAIEVYINDVDQTYYVHFDVDRTADIRHSTQSSIAPLHPADRANIAYAMHWEGIRQYLLTQTNGNGVFM
jgi:hypothetical protein